jgi:hypothetical protein
MKQLHPLVVGHLACILVLIVCRANAQMQMRQPMPMAPQASLVPREFVTEDQWINSIVDHWTASQRKSWRALDQRFSRWASHLIWLRKNAAKPSSDMNTSVPHLSSACAVNLFVAPTPSVDESMNYLRTILPEVDWNAWANIELSFRTIAEWEMSTQHYRAQVSKKLKEWWALNNEALQVCLNATASGEEVRPKTANARYVTIDRQARSERSLIDHMVAPEPIKNEAREQISDAAAVERYSADLDGIRP